MATSTIRHRITSLERWGMRAAHDFQPESCAFVKDAGYTGVFINGGSGIGPDMMPPESLAESALLPDMMPSTVQGNRRELARRGELLAAAGLDPWLCVWGVPGPDHSSDSPCAESNRFFDRRAKLEMSAKLQRSPELFGWRDPATLSWRGNRPLCLSHPEVQAYQRELYGHLPQAIPGLSGVFFFPGDGAEPECCDRHCPRCHASGRDPWAVMLSHVNAIYRALQAQSPGLPFYFCVWNQDHAEGQAFISRFLDELAPGIGIAMSITDNATVARKHGPMMFNQPWSNYAQPGELFLWTQRTAVEQGRPVMVLGEISQSEVWDPACHNVPTPLKTLDLLRNAEATPGVDAIMDFWGNRAPFLPHANHAMMRAWLEAPERSTEALLAAAAARHYGLTDQNTVAAAVACWAAWDTAMDDWALFAWTQRFSFAIGRDAARGRLYRPFLPAVLREDGWGVSMIRKSAPPAEQFLALQEADRERWLSVAGEFTALADTLAAAGLAGAATARREAANLELAGELIVSIARMVAASAAWNEQRTERLRSLTLAEIDARERQLAISGRLGLGAGVNPILVSEDIQNMRLFIADADFPAVPDERFHLTPCPYST